ncbi:head decoration protein [Embleya sp. NPDC059237]|uniref:head decoration protein n=1 Tax=Embleya sp. NPDC059237 TaxID=3346784 RepID=UPI0036C1387A
MTIQPVATSRQVSTSRAWLGGAHGTDSTETITLDITTLTSGVHYLPSPDTSQPYLCVLSGVPVGRITASRLYGAYDPAATDGRQQLRGFIYADAIFGPDVKKIPAALLWHGTVVATAVPGGIDVSKIIPSVTGPQIRFV